MGSVAHFLGVSLDFIQPANRAKRLLRQLAFISYMPVKELIAKAPLHLLVGLLFPALFFQNTLTFSERISHVLGIWLLVHLLRAPAFLM